MDSPNHIFRAELISSMILNLPVFIVGAENTKKNNDDLVTQNKSYLTMAALLIKVNSPG